MTELWDDRAVQVKLNTGKPLAGAEAAQAAMAAHHLSVGSTPPAAGKRG
jgi:hypothetical protein